MSAYRDADKELEQRIASIFKKRNHTKKLAQGNLR